MIASLYTWLTDANNISKVRTWHQADTPAANNPQTVKPYGIIEPGGLIPVLGDAGGKQQITLHVVFPVGSWVAPMEAAEELRRKLNGQTLTRNEGGERFRVEWESTVGGIHDVTLKAFVFTCIFSAPMRL